MSKDVPTYQALEIEIKLLEIEKEFLDLAKPRHPSQFGVMYSSGLHVIRFGNAAWEKTEFDPDSGARGRQDAERFDAVARSVAVIAELPGGEEPRERFLNGLLAYLRVEDSAAFQIYPKESESPHSIKMFDLARTSANYVRKLATQTRETLKTRPQERAETPKSQEPQLTKIDASTWRLDFPGAAPVVLPPMTGFDYIAELIRRTGQDVRATDLLRCVGSGRDTVDAGEAEATGIEHDTYSSDRNGAAVLDERAIKEYKKRIAVLRVEREEALGFGNCAEADEKLNEIELITSSIAKQVDKNGRIRKIGSDSEKARISVTKAISRALEKIGKKKPDAAAWLRDHVQTGQTCRFSPGLNNPQTL